MASAIKARSRAFYPRSRAWQGYIFGFLFGYCLVVTVDNFIRNSDLALFVPEVVYFIDTDGASLNDKGGHAVTYGKIGSGAVGVKPPCGDENKGGCNTFLASPNINVQGLGQNVAPGPITVTVIGKPKAGCLT